MDDLTLRYYDAEMRYLLEAGEEFALAHPEQAAMLNPDKAGARDPYVERLFEGFDFLMGRLREMLDDDLPELTEGLASLLWPHYLRTAAQSITLTQWTPALLFEVKSRRLRLLRLKAAHSETDKSRLQPEMDLLLSGLIAIDPASSAVLCG